MLGRVCQLGLAAAVLSAGPFAAGAEEEHQLSRLEEACVVVQQALAEELGDMAELAKTLFGTRLDGARAREMVAAWRAGAPVGARLLLADAAGRLLPAEEQVDEAAAPVIEPALWAQLLEQSEPVVGMARAPGQQELQCHTLFPLFDEEGAHTGAVCLAFPAARILDALCASLGLDEDEVFFVVGARGRVLYASPAAAYHAGESFTESAHVQGAGQLLEKFLAEYQGQELYVDESDTELARPRLLSWAQCLFMEMLWVLVVDQPAEGTVPENFAGEANPLSGRWLGASTVTRHRGAAGTEPVKEAGQLSVTIAQDGRNCSLTATTGWGEIVAHGLVEGQEMSAAQIRLGGTGRMEVWYWQATYDPERDALKGSLRGNAVDRVETSSFYLRRTETARAPSSPAAP